MAMTTYAFLLMKATIFSRHHRQHLQQYMAHSAHLLADCKDVSCLSRNSRISL